MTNPAVWELTGKEESFKLSHRIVSDKRGIELTIPFEIISHLISSGNGGKRFLITVIFNSALRLILTHQL